MTIDEAIEILKENYENYSETMKEIIDKAIEATEKEKRRMTREEAAQIIHDLKTVAEEYDEGYYLSSVELEAMGMAIEALKQPEQKKGKWVKKADYGTTIFECSCCHQVKPYEIGNSPDELIFWDCKYCPECGAKMEGE